MSTTTQKHVDHAELNLDAVAMPNSDTEARDAHALVANAHATLALVEEVRTANLIAYRDIVARRGGHSPEEDQLERIVLERLGLS